MHHSGPPRFTSVGESVELAPRNPTPSETYTWSLHDKPDRSTLSIEDGSVVELAPDVPGLYRAQLDAPDGSHELTIRAFPDERRNARFVLDQSDLPVDRDTIDSISLGGSFNDWLYDRLEPTWVDPAERDRTEGAFVYETRLRPGVHRYLFLINREWTDDTLVGGDLTVDGPGRPRLHLDATRRDDTINIEAHASPPPDGEATVDVEFYVDDRDDLDRADLTVTGRTATIPASRIDGMVRIHAVPVAERYGVADTVEVSVDGQTLDVNRPTDPPEWIHDARVYEIFVRSFAGDRIETTFGEIRRRIPYLESLGVNTVWLTPVLASPTRHGYHITDYFETANDLGTRDEFEALVEACHDHGIRVVFDLVINHTATAHPHFHLSASGVKTYRDWYIWETDGAGSQSAQHYFGWEDIPNVNYRNLDVRRHMLDVVDEWSDVVDGFRADVAWGVPHGFWKEVRDRIKGNDAEFLMLDETVPRQVGFSEGEFDLHHDTDLHDTLREVGTGEQPATSLLAAIKRSEWMGYPENAGHLHYVENHDEDRYLAECDREALKAAAAATVTLPGVPMVYYGQERGMTDYRGPMKWIDGDKELTAFHRSLLAAHEDHDVIRRGHLAELDWHADTNEAVAFALEHGDERVIVALNFGKNIEAVIVEEALESLDVLSGDSIKIESTSDGSVVSVENAVVVRSSEQAEST